MTPMEFEGDELQNAEPPVLEEVSIEGDGFPDPKSLHDDEAQGVAEGICLVLVGAEERDGALLVGPSNAFYAVRVAQDHVKKGHGSMPPAPGACEDEGVCLDHDRIRGDEAPALGAGLAEKSGAALMEPIFGRQEREEATAVDEDPLHCRSGSGRQASVRYLYLSEDTSEESV